jgi:hypothetical protein
LSAFCLRELQHPEDFEIEAGNAKMLVAATFFSTHLSDLHKRWRIENSSNAPPRQLTWRKTDFRLPGANELGPSLQGTHDYAGLMVIYDWNRGQVLWQSAWAPTVIVPAGFCFSDQAIYLADSESASLFRIEVSGEFGRISSRVSHPYFNDLHSVQRTKRGFLVSCSGNDSIVEIDPKGNLLFEWWAAEHGYTLTPAGVPRESGRGIDHRSTYYHTRFHATHVNSAVIQDEDEQLILALLFQQGVVVQIDRRLPEPDQSPRIIVDQLVRPHGLERTRTGWLFCNTLGKELIALHPDLTVSERIPYDGIWIQDCTMLSNGNILLADVDQHCIVELSGPKWNPVKTIYCDPEWRLAELNEVPLEYAKWISQSFDGAAGPCPELMTGCVVRDVLSQAPLGRR